MTLGVVPEQSLGVVRFSYATASMSGAPTPGPLLMYAMPHHEGVSHVLGSLLFGLGPVQVAVLLKASTQVHSCVARLDFRSVLAPLLFACMLLASHVPSAGDGSNIVLSH